MNLYAQLNGDNICIGVSRVSGKITSSKMIPVGPDDDVIGKAWTGSGFVAVPFSNIPAAIEEKGNQLWTEFTTRMQLPIIYDGNKFLVDDWSIKTIETTMLACLAMGLANTDPVPTEPPLQPGYWLAADMDGVARIPVPMSYGRFKGLVHAAYSRNAKLWGALVIHRTTIEAMVAQGATAQQIMDYDHTQGW